MGCSFFLHVKSLSVKHSLRQNSKHFLPPVNSGKKLNLKGIVMQIEKTLINDCSCVSKVYLFLTRADIDCSPL